MRCCYRVKVRSLRRNLVEVESGQTLYRFKKISHWSLAKQSIENVSVPQKLLCKIKCLSTFILEQLKAQGFNGHAQTSLYFLKHYS